MNGREVEAGNNLSTLSSSTLYLMCSSHLRSVADSFPSPTEMRDRGNSIASAVATYGSRGATTCRFTFLTPLGRERYVPPLGCAGLICRNAIHSIILNVKFFQNYIDNVLILEHNVLFTDDQSTVGSSDGFDIIRPLTSQLLISIVSHTAFLNCRGIWRNNLY